MTTESLHFPCALQKVPEMPMRLTDTIHLLCRDETCCSINNKEGNEASSREECRTFIVK